MRKKILVYITFTIAFVGCSFVLVPFVGSLSPSAKAKAERYDVVYLPPIEEGEFREMVVHGKPFYMYRPSEIDLGNIAKLSSHVSNPAYNSYNEKLGIFFVWGISTKLGCKLSFIGPQESRLGKRWLGGYFDPCHDPSYDFAGRMISDYEYTFNGYNSKFPNLDVPIVKQLSGNKVEVIDVIGANKW